MLLKINPSLPSGLQNMTITYFPSMGLFTQVLNLPSGTFTVTHTNPSTDQQTSLEIPLQPDIEDLEIVDVVLHRSPTKAYDMGISINAFFSTAFGFAVKLVYLGPHLRPVLGNLSPNTGKPKQSSWLSSITSSVPFLSTPDPSSQKQDVEGITFADVAPYLIITQESLDDVSSRLPEDEQPMDLTKFRPNIVLSGSPAAWDEDFWGQLLIASNVELILTQNCARCVSLNVDYSTGQIGTGESGKVLKKLMKDRRVDPGAKYSPIFGRYGFLDTKGEGKGEMVIGVGDRVDVSRRNEERTVFGTYLTRGRERGGREEGKGHLLTRFDRLARTGKSELKPGTFGVYSLHFVPLRLHDR
jgi:uncharacterized protein YcbX